MGSLVEQGLHHGGVVHVRAHHHGASVPAREAVGTTDGRSARDRPDREASCLHQLSHGVAQARRRGVGEEPGAGEQVEARRLLAGFRVAHVFSVHQTSGPALAEPPRPRLLAGEAPPGLGDAMRKLVEARGFSVGTVPGAAAIGGANGLTRWDERSVVVRADMDDAAMVKTLLHEAAHVLLHEAEPGRSLPREAKEVEAESVAYLVAAAHGMSTGDYSFPYVAAWAGKDGVRAVQAVQARVALAARGLIAASPAPCSGGGRPPGPAAVPTGRSAGSAPLPGRSAATVPSGGPAL